MATLDFDAISHWLTTSILGIILLGAAGSAVFAFVFWLGRAILFRLFPSLLKAIGRSVERFATNENAQEAILERNLDLFLPNLFFAHNLLLGLIGAIAFALVTFAYSLQVDTGATFDKFTLIVVGGIAFTASLRACLRITFLYWFWFRGEKGRAWVAEHIEKSNERPRG